MMKSEFFLPKGYQLMLNGIKYEIVKLLGHGGSSMVYSAICENGPVIIKELFPKNLVGRITRRNYDAQDMFLNIPPDCEEQVAMYRGRAEYEFEVLQKLRTREEIKNGEVVNVMADAWFASYNRPVCLNNTLYTVIASADGEMLADMMSFENKDTHFEDFTDICEQILRILEALEPMHKHISGAYLHLDIAPDNVLVLAKKVAGYRETNLIDFNSAYKMNTTEARDRLFSMKEHYSAPELEQLKGSGTADPKAKKLSEAADLFSVVVIFFELLMERLPNGDDYNLWERNENIVLLNKDANTREYIKPLFLRTIKKANDVLKKGLQYGASERYGSIEMLRRDINALVCDAKNAKKFRLKAKETAEEQAKKWKRDNARIYELLHEDGKYIPMTLKETDSEDVYNTENFLCCLETKERRHAFIIGDGGMGKTTTCINALEMCLKNHDQVIYIPLNEYDQMEYVKKCIMVAFGLLTSVKQNIPQDANDNYETLISEEDIILLLDGLNEIIDFNNQKAFFNELKELAEKNHIQIVLTSRSDAPHFVPGVFTKLTFEYITRDYIDKWLSARFSWSGDIPYETLGNPMLLNMYAIDVREQGTLSNSQRIGFLDNPTTAGEIVWNFFEHQIRKSQNIFTPSDDDRDFSAVLFRHILPYIAYRVEKRENENTYFTIEDAEEYEEHVKTIGKGIKKICKDYRFRESAIARYLSRMDRERNLLDDICVQRYGILLHHPTTGNTYKFAHQHFRDILSATHIRNQMMLNDKEVFTERIFPHHISQMLMEILQEHKYKPPHVDLN